VRLEGLGKLKISTSSGLDPTTFRLVSIVPQPTTQSREEEIVRVEIAYNKRLVLVYNCQFDYEEIHCEHVACRENSAGSK
jgi:hypothetical protein